MLIATVIATPYSLDYDLMLLAPAIAFIAADGIERGFAPYRRTMLALLWLVPLVARTVADATAIPLAVPMMLLAYITILHRGISEANDAAMPAAYSRVA